MRAEQLFSRCFSKFQVVCAEWATGLKVQLCIYTGGMQALHRAVAQIYGRPAVSPAASGMPAATAAGGAEVHNFVLLCCIALLKQQPLRKGTCWDRR